jgi:hypothetical protein
LEFATEYAEKFAESLDRRLKASQPLVALAESFL